MEKKCRDEMRRNVGGKAQGNLGNERKIISNEGGKSRKSNLRKGKGGK